MSVDSLGPSPRRMAKAPPPPVPPKRFQVKDALQELGVQPRSPTQEERKPSAVERLAADKGRFIKSQPIVLSKTPQMTAVPVTRKQLLVPPGPSKATSPKPKASPQRPVRKTAPLATGHSAGVPLLDLKHLTNLISGVGESAGSPPASQTAASSCSLSSDGAGGDEDCHEPAVPPPTSDPASFDKLPLASPASLAQLSSPSPSSPSPSLDSARRAGSDASGSQGCSPAVAVRRVDVRPQMAAPVRKAMHGPMHHGCMPAQMQMQMPMAAHAKLQQQAQSHAHLMHLMRAQQMASKNAAVLPRNSPLMPKLPAGGAHGMPGMAAQRAGISPSSQPFLPPQQSSNGSPTLKSPTIPGTPQPVSATTPQSAVVTPTTPLPLRTTSPPAGQLAEPQAPPAAAAAAAAAATAAPTPPTLFSSTLGAFLQGGSNSPIPIPVPSPSPSITRLSSSSSRKRPSLTRSKSDMSDRFSRAGADLERFFNYCGLDPADLDDLAQQSSSDIASVSRLRSASAPASECSQGHEADEEEDEDDKGGPQVPRTPYGISVIERNARVIKWLYGLRQARDPARVANI